MSDEKEEKDYIERKEALLVQIQQAGHVRETDRKELKDMLSRPSLQRALHQVLVESDAQSTILLGINLEDPAQRASATRSQGVAQGLLRAIESIIDNIPEEEDKN